MYLSLNQTVTSPRFTLDTRVVHLKEDQVERKHAEQEQKERQYAKCHVPQTFQSEVPFVLRCI